jgi:hypothetical protein
MKNIYLTTEQIKDTKYNARLHSFSQRSDRNKGRKLSLIKVKQPLKKSVCLQAR